MANAGAGRHAPATPLSPNPMEVLARVTLTLALAAPLATANEPLLPVSSLRSKAALQQLHAGTLVLVGGGAIPRDVAQAFVQAAGGKGAELVVIPTASRKKGAGARRRHVLANSGLHQSEHPPHTRASGRGHRGLLRASCADAMQSGSAEGAKGCWPRPTATRASNANSAGCSPVAVSSAEPPPAPRS